MSARRTDRLWVVERCERGRWRGWSFQHTKPRAEELQAELEHLHPGCLWRVRPYVPEGSR